MVVVGAILAASFLGEWGALRLANGKGCSLTWGCASRLADCRWDKCDVCDKWDIVNAGSWLLARLMVWCFALCWWQGQRHCLRGVLCLVKSKGKGRELCTLPYSAKIEVARVTCVAPVPPAVFKAQSTAACKGGGSANR